MNLELKEITELMSQFDQSDIHEFKLEIEGIRLSMKKAQPAAMPIPPMPPAMPMPQAAAMPQPTAGQIAPGQAVSVQATPAQAAPVEAEEATGVEVRSPLAGIFYRASKPGEKPFVEVGSHVEAGDTVGLIEAMKIINEIPAPCSGIVREILASDGEFAQYDAVLIRIEEK